MALDTYDNLKQAIALWSHREDDVVGEIANDCVTMAEQEIYHGQSPLRVPEMITEVEVASSVRLIDLPARCLEIIGVFIDIDDIYYEIKHVPSIVVRESDDTAQPTHYTVTNQILLSSTPDKEYTFKIRFYQKPLPLSDTDTTNSILVKYPMAYLFGGVAMAHLFANEDDLSSNMVIRMRDVIAKANSDAKNLFMGHQPITIIDGVIP